MTSADFLQLTFFDYEKKKLSISARPHRISRLTFLFYSLNLLHKITYIFWALTCHVVLPSYTALVSSFCSSSQDFDTHFLHFHLTMDSLCFSMRLAIYTPATDFHRLVKRHACRTYRVEDNTYCVSPLSHHHIVPFGNGRFNLYFNMNFLILV